MFKVVPDQLRVSDGWVRCGQCNEVFDANSNLQPRPEIALNSSKVSPPDTLPPPAPAPAVFTPPVEPATTTAIAQAKVEAQVEVRFAAKSIDVVQPAAQTAAPVEEVAPLPTAPFLDVGPRALPIEREPEEIVVASPPATLGEQRSSVVRGEKPRRARKEPAARIQHETPQHSFMANGTASATWSKPWARAVFWAASMLLVVGLVGQVVVQERDRIAATDPSTLRVLEPLCAVLACKISPLRQIESIVIDSSSFSKTRADVYRLSFTLKNTAQTAVATPSVELTLTDMQDQAVVRRVFVATEFGRQQTMEPGTELPITIPVSVKPSAGSAKVSGYRLLSFYP